MFVSIYIKATFAPEWCILHANFDGERRKSSEPLRFFDKTLDIVNNLLTILINIYCDNLCPSRCSDRFTWPDLYSLLLILNENSSMIKFKKIVSSVTWARDIFIYFQGLDQVAEFFSRKAPKIICVPHFQPEVQKAINKSKLWRIALWKS